MLKIRLRRVGKKKQPLYRMVVADSRAPRDGAFVEILGQYNPRTEPSTININEERARYWLSKGAQPSDRAAKLLAVQGVMELPPKLKAVIEATKARPKPAKEAPAAETPAAAAPAAPAAPAAAAPTAAEPEAPVAEAPAAEAPAAEVPAAEPEAPVAETPAAEAPAAEEAQPGDEGAEAEEPEQA